VSAQGHSRTLVWRWLLCKLTGPGDHDALIFDALSEWEGDTYLHIFTSAGQGSQHLIWTNLVKDSLTSKQSALTMDDRWG